MFPLDDNFVFGDNFFSLGDNFFFAEGDKKNYSPKEKKITHQKTKLFIQRKHLYAYDMTFLCPPPFYFCALIGENLIYFALTAPILVISYTAPAYFHYWAFQVKFAVRVSISGIPTKPQINWQRQFTESTEN